MKEIAFVNFKLLSCTILIILLASNIFSVHGQWQKKCGISGGKVYCLIAGDDDLFAGTDSGVFISSNNGAFWKPVNIGLLKSPIVTASIIGNNFFAGTRDSGIFLSTNRGETWTSVHSGITNFFQWSLVVVGTDLFASTQNGVYRSENNGRTWVTGNAGLPANPIIYCLEAYGDSLFAGTARSVYLSTDHGKNWNIIGSELPSMVIVQSLVKFGANFIVGTRSGIYTSYDNGTNWQFADSNLAYVGVISLARNGTNIFAGTEKGAFLSTDTGASWTLTGIGLPSTISIRSFTVKNNLLFACTDDHGVFQSSNNGRTWKSVGLATISIRSLFVVGDTVFAGTEGYGVLKSFDNGSNWAVVSSGLTDTIITCITKSGHNLVAGTYWYKGILLSADGGITWTASNSITHENDFINALLSIGTDIFAGTSYGLFLSTDNGVSWSAVGLFNNQVNCLYSNGDTLFTGTSTGAYYSTDKGLNCYGIAQGPRSLSLVTSLIKCNNNFLAATSYDGTFLLDNATKNWTSANSGLPDWAVIRCFAESGTNTFGGTGYGVYLSTNNVVNWSNVSTGLTDQTEKNIHCLAISGTNLLAGTTAGIWQRSILDFASIKHDINNNPKIVTLKLHSNPSSLFIRISLPISGKVSIKLYALSGHLIAQPYNKHFKAGNHSMTLSTQAIHSGNYILRMVFGKEVYEKQFTLLR